MPFEDWGSLTAVLLDGLHDLTDGDFLVLGEPGPPAGPRRGLLRRRSAPEPARYVQVLRVGDSFSAECVGARSLGGTWEMGPATIAELRAVGWLVPAESRDTYGNVTPNFACYVAVEDTADLARLLVRSLQVLDVDPAALELQMSR